MKVKGTVQRSDLEGGLWLLDAGGGLKYQLVGGDEGLRVAGQKVEVVGEIKQDMLSLGMAGSMLRVETYRTL